MGEKSFPYQLTNFHKHTIKVNHALLSISERVEVV